MHLATVALGLLCQSIEPLPGLAELGQEVTVTVTSVTSEPVVRQLVVALDPSGSQVQLGETDANGEVVFVPDQVGDWELRADLTGGKLRLIRLLSVVPAPRRWLYALICVPIGLLLLWTNLRVRRRVG